MPRENRPALGSVTPDAPGLDDLLGCIVHQRRSRRVANVQLHPLIVRKTSTAMAVETGRSFSISNPRCNAVR